MRSLILACSLSLVACGGDVTESTPGAGGSAGNGSGGNGSTGNGSGSTSSGDPACPPQEPTSGSACPIEGQTCSYGACCPTLAECVGGEWSIAITDCGPSCPDAPPAAGA